MYVCMYVLMYLCMCPWTKKSDINEYCDETKSLQGPVFCMQVGQNSYNMILEKKKYMIDSWSPIVDQSEKITSKILKIEK